jgi:plasmid stabilization system protein ParE
MLPPELTTDLPGNLSRRAVVDLVSILRCSAREFGIPTARRSRDRIIEYCRVIASGRAVGHSRTDVTPRVPTMFINVPPWVISYNPVSREVTRIIHGVRDFPAIFR